MSIFSESLEHIIYVFGEPVIFKGGGDLFESLEGIVSVGTERIDSLGEVHVDLEEMSVTVSSDHLSRPPKRGDVLHVRGKDYKSSRMEVDGEGEVILFLKEV